MRLHFCLLALLCLMLPPGLFAATQAKADVASKPKVLLIDMHDTLQPERADVLLGWLTAPQRSQWDAVVINMSSPGGFADSTDRIVEAMQQSTVPVIVWLGTGQSRVSGQALRLVAAADIALMSSGAYLTPLWTDPPRGLTAQARSSGSAHLTAALSQAVNTHGRSASAVDELSSGIHWFTAKEALQAGFIDGIADKQTDMLRWVTAHGYKRSGVHHDLNLLNANVTPAWSTPKIDLLLALMNPNLCVLVLTLGLLLIYLEINTPGVVIPGAAGLLLTLLAAYSLSRLPLNSAGIALSGLAMVLLLVESQVRRHGLLASAGILALIAGLALLVKGPLPQLQVSWGTAFGAGLGFGGITASLMLLGIEARRAKIRTGAEAMLGWLAVAHTPLKPEGQILVRGELWRARLTTNDGAVAAGEHVKVLRADGLTLEVTAVPMATSN